MTNIIPLIEELPNLGQITSRHAFQPRYLSTLLRMDIKQMSDNDFKNLLLFVELADSDAIKKYYLLNNEDVFNRIKEKIESPEFNLSGYIIGQVSGIKHSVAPEISIKSSDIKVEVLKKYLFIFEADLEFDHYNHKRLVETIFSLDRAEDIQSMFQEEIVKRVLNEKRGSHYGTEWAIESIITHKKTDEEKIKCISPAVFAFLRPLNCSRILVSLESDILRKECMDNEELSQYVKKKDATFREENHSFAYVVAAHKSNEIKDEEIEIGLKEDTLDGRDLAIIISSRTGDAKKDSYREDERISKKLSFEDECYITASYEEDEVKRTFIESNLNNSNLTDFLLRMIIESMKDDMKEKCLQSEKISQKLSFEDKCYIVRTYKNDEKKYKFIKGHIEELRGKTGAFGIINTMQATYRRVCIEDAEISTLLDEDSIFLLISSDYDKEPEEHVEADKLRLQFIAKYLKEEQTDYLTGMIKAIAEDEIKTWLLLNPTIYIKIGKNNCYEIRKSIKDKNLQKSIIIEDVSYNLKPQLREASIPLKKVLIKLPDEAA